MADLRLTVDHHGPVAPFEQVKSAITAQVDSGELPAGFRLPPVRTLAASLGVAANTVARAYRELEALGVVETRGRAGTFVAGRGTARAAREAAAAYVAAARSLGLDDAEVVELVRRHLSLGGSDRT